MKSVLFYSGITLSIILAAASQFYLDKIQSSVDFCVQNDPVKIKIIWASAGTECIMKHR